MNIFVIKFFRPKWVAFSFIVLVLMNCSRPDVDVHEMITIPVEPAMVMDSLAAGTLIKEISFIPLETNNNSFFSEVTKVQQYKNIYIIQDRHTASTVLAFDTTGSFLFRYGSKGSGTGEYILPMDIAIDERNRELLVVNSERRSMNYYDLVNGGFKRMKKYNFPISSIHKRPGGDFVISGSGRADRVIFADSDLVKKSSVFPYSSRYSQLLINQLQVINDSVLSFRLSYNDTVYEITKHNELVPYAYVDFRDDKLTNGYYDSLPVPMKAKLYQHTFDKRTNLITYAENADTRVFGYRYRNANYTCLQDKHTQRVISFANDKLSDTLFPVKHFPLILGVDNNGNFLCFIKASNILENKNLERIFRQSGLAEKYLISEFSNPILVKIKFK